MGEYLYKDRGLTLPAIPPYPLLKRGQQMNKRKLEERKKYLVLQAFYLKVKELIEELEKKLNPKMIKLNKPDNDL